jgi:hypothetical protein
VGTTKPWFDTTAFTQPVGAVLGNVGKNVFSGPGVFTFDSSLTRNIPIHENWSVQLRMDAFNTLNHPNFANPATSLTSTTFGQVTQTYPTANQGSRLLQFAATLSF